MNDQNNTFSWTNPKISIKNSSIDGECFFADRLINKDELLVVQAGQCKHLLNDIDNTELEKHSYHGFQVDGDIYIFPFFIEGKPYLDGIFKINHSCDPSAGFRGQISLVAIREIQPGEEITFDYAMTDIEFDYEKKWDNDKEKCNCGTSSCRGKITGQDWKNTDLQEKYKGYFSTHVALAIDKVNKNKL